MSKRLTLTEQVTLQEEQITKLRDELRQVREINAVRLSTIENLQTEAAGLRSKLRQEGELAAELEKVKAALASKESSYTYAMTEKNKAEAEIEQAHAVLDGVDGAPSRDYEGEYGKRHRNVVTRLAGAFLAIAKNGGAK